LFLSQKRRLHRRKRCPRRNWRSKNLWHRNKINANKKIILKSSEPGKVAQVCNPSYLEGGVLEDQGSRSAQAKY
jgi:hypothetical protein